MWRWPRLEAPRERLVEQLPSIGFSPEFDTYDIDVIVRVAVLATIPVSYYVRPMDGASVGVDLPAQPGLGWAGEGEGGDNVRLNSSRGQVVTYREYLARLWMGQVVDRPDHHPQRMASSEVGCWLTLGLGGAGSASLELAKEVQFGARCCGGGGSLSLASEVQFGALRGYCGRDNAVTYM